MIHLPEKFLEMKIKKFPNNFLDVLFSYKKSKNTIQLFQQSENRFQLKTITLTLNNACAFLPVLAQCATGVCRCKAAGVLAWKLEAGGQSRRAVASEQLPPASKKAKIL